MNDAADGQDPEREPVTGTAIDSTTGYLKIVFLNPISVAGIVIAVAGILLISLDTPPRPPVFAAGLMLFGMVVFALGYTRAQRIIKRCNE